MIFNLMNLINEYKMKIKGVIHVGAYVGGELTEYRSLGLFNTIYFEPQKHLFEIVQAKCIKNEAVYNVALGNINDEEMDLYISHSEGGIQNGSGASSSLLKPKVHLIEHPTIKFIRKDPVKVYRLDNFTADQGINVEEYNLLNIDVQGYELEVLKGAEKSLEHIDYIIAEVNRDEVYAGCPLIGDIDNYLKDFGFIRAMVGWQSISWGDAFYMKEAQ